MTEQDYKSLKTSLRITQILCIVIAVLLLATLTAGGILIVKVLPAAKTAMETIQPIAQAAKALNGVDMKAVAQNISDIEQMASSVDWKQVSDQLNSLDVDSINTALQGIDFDQLQEAVQNLNALAETLRKLPFFG
ncbi:MAG: hypothetical protein IKS07_11470 [Lachnospiraceae bacterium]|nr:hypothetical protein [Lachnospiraceae bacterium]